MNKKYFTLIMVLLVLLTIFLVVFLLNSRKDFNNKVIDVVGDYTIKEIDDEIIIENKNIGLTAKIPDGWRAGGQYNPASDKKVLTINNPDVVIEYNELKTGCEITLADSDDSFGGTQQIRELISRPDLLEQNMQILDIAGHQALKIRLNTLNGYYDSISLPLGDISFDIGFIVADDVACEDGLFDFLSNIKINYEEMPSEIVDASGWKNYRDQASNFEISYPGDWNLIIANHGEMLIATFSELDFNEYYLMLNWKELGDNWGTISVVQGALTNNLDETVENLRKSLENNTIIENLIAEEVEIGNIKAYKLYYNKIYPFEGRLTYFVPNRNKNEEVRIIGRFMVEDKGKLEEYSKKLEEIYSTFKFLEE